MLYKENKNDYCQEDLYPIENIQTIPEFAISENLFNENQPILPNNKDVDSEIIQRDNIFISKNSREDQNFSKELPKKIIFDPIDTKLNLKTEIEKTAEKTNKKSNSILKNKNKKNKNSQQTKKENKHNLLRKSKKIIFDTALMFINSIISVVYNGNIGHGIFKKELKKIDPFENRNTLANHNRDLLNKFLKDVFSANINKKYSGYPLDFNKKIIEQLLNEEDENKKNTFTNLFNITVHDWILMLEEPKGELKVIYENNLLKSCKKEESINKMINTINKYGIEFHKMKPRKKDDNK